MKRLMVALAVAVALLLTGLACGLATPGAELVCPDSPMGEHDGVWVGTTGEGDAITLTIEAGWVRSIDTRFEVASPGARAVHRGPWPVGVPVVRDRINAFYDLPPWTLGFAALVELDAMRGVLLLEWTDPADGLGRLHVPFTAVRVTSDWASMLVH